MTNGGITALVAIVTQLRRSATMRAARCTARTSRWQIRTFWWYRSWMALAGLCAITVLLFPLAVAIWKDFGHCGCCIVSSRVGYT